MNNRTTGDLDEGKAYKTSLVLLYIYATFKVGQNFGLGDVLDYENPRGDVLGAEDAEFFKKTTALLNFKNIIKLVLFSEVHTSPLLKILEKIITSQSNSQKLSHPHNSLSKFSEVEIAFLNLASHEAGISDRINSRMAELLTREFGLFERISRATNKKNAIFYLLRGDKDFHPNPTETINTVLRVFRANIRGGLIHNGWMANDVGQLCREYGTPIYDVEEINKLLIQGHENQLEELTTTVAGLRNLFEGKRQTELRNDENIKATNERIDSLIDQVSEINKIAIKLQTEAKEADSTLKKIVNKIESALSSLPDQIFSAVDAAQRIGKRSKRLAFQVISDGKILLRESKTIITKLHEVSEAVTYPHQHTEIDFQNLVAEVNASSTSFNLVSDVSGPQKLTSGKAEWKWIVTCLPHASGEGLIHFTVWEIDSNGYREKVHEEYTRLEIIASPLEKMNQMFTNGNTRYFAFAITLAPIVIGIVGIYVAYLALK